MKLTTKDNKAVNEKGFSTLLNGRIPWLPKMVGSLIKNRGEMMYSDKRYEKADNFIKNLVEPTYEELLKAFLAAGKQYEPAEWEELHEDIMFWSARNRNGELHDELFQLSYPVELYNRDLEIEDLNHRELKKVKEVSDRDHDELVGFIKGKQDLVVLAAVEIMREVGCEVLELPSLILFSSNEVQVQTETGHLKYRKIDEGVSAKIVKDIEVLFNPEFLFTDKTQRKISHINTIQQRLRQYVTALWPERVEHISLYSYESNELQYVGHHGERIFTLLKESLDIQRKKVLGIATEVSSDGDEDEPEDIFEHIVFYENDILENYVMYHYFGFSVEDLDVHESRQYQDETVRMAVEILGR